jgi:hypothetical protein
MDFQIWSKSNPEAVKELRPDFGLRNWDEISVEEKKIMWKFLVPFFFDPRLQEEEYSREPYYPFIGDEYEASLKRKRISTSIAKMTYDAPLKKAR